MFINNTACLKDTDGCQTPCPSHCRCDGTAFKCNSPENLRNEVKVLDLSLNSINTSYLRQFNFLVHLNISRCSIIQSSLAVLSNKTFLQNLDLSYNNIIDLDSGAFSGLSSLMYLNISNNQIRSLRMNFISNTPKLIHLIINNNCIEDIVADLDPYNQQLSNLKVLDLRNNNLKTIDPTSLYSIIDGLVDLDVSFNAIKIIPYYMFQSYDKIKKLNLQHNLISNLKRFSFLTLNTLLELDLSYNSIQNIREYMFKGLKKLEVLNLRNNSISMLDGYTFSDLLMLDELDISYNSIFEITHNIFEGLDGLRILNLHNNMLTILNESTFSNLKSLHSLDLACNQIQLIHEKAFEGLVSLKKLNLTGNRIKALASSRFVALVKLEIFDLSENNLEILDHSTFQGLHAVKYLYIHSNKLTVFRTMFHGLSNLEWLRTDSYIICCAKPSTVSSNNCIAPRDSISSCEQLISVGFLSQTIWYMALFSVIGNAFVIYYRNCGGIEGSNSHCVFVLHLSISDFLMGLYLFIIAIADLEYQNIYGFNDSEWRYSTTCTIAGLLATTSSEASVMFIFLITMERFIVLKYPFSAGVFKNRISVVLITIIAWLIAIAFSAVPLCVYQDFYSRSTVCISLPLTTERVSGWEYSTLLFIGFNLLIFIAVVVGQLLIYIHVKRMGEKINNDNTKREMKVLRSLSYVVVSDTFSWIPIILIGKNSF